MKVHVELTKVDGKNRSRKGMKGNSGEGKEEGGIEEKGAFDWPFCIRAENK